MYQPNYVSTDIFKYEMYQTVLDVDVDKIKNFCLSLKKKSKGRKISNLTGWQSEDIVDFPPYLQKLKELIEFNANIYSKTMHIKKELQLDNMWININEYKDSNEPHIHPHSIVSGSFYLSVSEDSGGIKFYNPLSETMNYVLNDDIVDKWTQTNCSRWVVVPVQSVLLLFPGWLKHSVQPNNDKKLKRISISFNLK